ncbi:TIGR04076 family protein [Peptococcaceae bacterium 1198_IL3148]
MGKRPKIRITVINKIGPGVCHRGHKIGDTFDFDSERGKICPMAMHVLFPVVDILRYGGSFPWEEDENTGVFCCPDVKVINVFKVEKITE